MNQSVQDRQIKIWSEEFARKKQERNFLRNLQKCQKPDLFHFSMDGLHLIFTICLINNSELISTDATGSQRSNYLIDDLLRRLALSCVSVWMHWNIFCGILRVPQSEMKAKIRSETLDWLDKSEPEEETENERSDLERLSRFYFQLGLYSKSNLTNILLSLRHW